MSMCTQVWDNTTWAEVTRVLCFYIYVNIYGNVSPNGHVTHQGIVTCKSCVNLLCYVCPQMLCVSPNVMWSSNVMWLSTGSMTTLCYVSPRCYVTHQFHVTRPVHVSSHGHVPYTNSVDIQCSATPRYYRNPLYDHVENDHTRIGAMFLWVKRKHLSRVYQYVNWSDPTMCLLTTILQ